MITTLVSIVLYIVVLGLICWLLMWLIDYVPVPEPFNKVAKIVIAVLGVVAIIYLLLGILPGGHGLPRLT